MTDHEPKQAQVNGDICTYCLRPWLEEPDGYCRYANVHLETQLRADNARLLDRALTAEARVAQLERAIADDPLESELLRALIAEAHDLLLAGHEPGEYAESTWISGVVNTLKEAEHE